MHDRTRPDLPALRPVAIGVMLMIWTGCFAAEPPPASDAGPLAMDRHATGVGGLDGCSAGTAERRPLILSDGLHAYVEPTRLMQVGEDIVVVGSPTYTWEVGGEMVRMVTRDEHIAAYLWPGEPRLVEKPLDVPIDGPGVRSVPLDAQRWGVLLPERDPDTTSLGDVVHVWYAEYDGNGWTDPEGLPLPEGHDLFPASSSDLVATGNGSVAWAVLDRNRRSVDFYERASGEWHRSPVPDSDVEATALSIGPSGTWLALSGLDPGVSGQIKTVRLYHLEGSWRLVSRNPTSEPYTEIGRPHLMDLPAGVTLTWSEMRGEGVVLARVSVTSDWPGDLVVVDDASPVARPFATPAGTQGWVVQHNDVIGQFAELRVLTLGNAGVLTKLSAPFPYTGFYAVLATGPEQVVVTGSDFDPDPARPTVRSLTLRLNLTCQ